MKKIAFPCAFSMPESMNKVLWCMKLSFILVLAACLQVSAKGYSQNDVKLSLHLTDVKLAKALTVIEKKSDHRILFSDDILPAGTRVRLEANDMPLADILNQVLANTGLHYRMLDNNVIIIAPANAVMAAITIKGRITDNKGAPLIGVTVKVEGSNIGTVTDQNGNYEIDAPSPTGYLVFSFIGYVSQRVAIGGQTQVNMILQESPTGLNEVVVVGYGTQKKVNLTGAVSTISGEVLENRPIPNIGRGLQGQLPGLNITSNDGQPGRGTTFNIRGFTSINGGSPLILVDGVSTNINDINPDDVASVTVLKDAAAAAVYGSRAPFGVILITTKNGQKGGPTVSYSMNYAVHKITNLPDVVTDPATVIDFKNQAYAGYYGVNLYNTAAVAYAKQRSQNPGLPATIVNPTNPNSYQYFGATNWFNELYKPDNISQIHNLSVSGGSDKITYYFSGDYNKQMGVFRYNPDYYDRYNLRAKLDFQATKWLHIYTNSAYNRTIYNYPSLWTSDWTAGDLYHEIGRENSLSVLKNPDGSWTSAGVDIGFLQQGGRGNTVTNESQNTIGFNTSFFKDTWRIKGDYTFRGTNDYNQQYRVAMPYETGPNQKISYAGHSDASAWSDDNAYKVINLYSEYEKTFAGKHYFKGMIGYNQELNNYNYFSAQNNQLISSNVGYLDVTTGTTPSVHGNGYNWAVRGAFYRLNYIYNDKYLLELDGRYDGSSRFPPDEHYGFFPSASAGWRISEEPFFKGLTAVVNNLKLRASYGSLGNDQSLGNYDFIPTLGSGQIGNILGGVQPTAVYPPNLVAPNLTWEKVYSKDIGADIALFDRLDASFDWYERDTKDMITKGFQLPAVLGATQPKENAADLRTNGWELNLNYHDQLQLAGKPFRYNVRVNLWDNQTVITRYNNPNKFWFGGDYYVGEHTGDIWGLTTLGIFQTDASAKTAPDQSKVTGYYGQQAGEIQYADLNHDGKINYGDGTVANPGDAHVIGNTTPRYNFGMGGNFTWNNIDFSIFFQGVGKKSFWPGTTGYYWSMFFAPWENVYKNIVGTTWTTQNSNAFYPSLKGWRAGDDGPWVDLAVPQTRYLYSAAYIRLKNLSIGYTLPFPVLQRMGVEHVRLYFSGEDLWESDKLPQGFDPEGLNGAWGAGKIYPFQRAYSFGLDVRF